MAVVSSFSSEGTAVPIVQVLNKFKKQIILRQKISYNCGHNEFCFLAVVADAPPGGWAVN